MQPDAAAQPPQPAPPAPAGLLIEAGTGQLLEHSGAAATWAAEGLGGDARPPTGERRAVWEVWRLQRRLHSRRQCQDPFLPLLQQRQAAKTIS